MYKKKIIVGYSEREVTYDKNLEFMPNASAGINCWQTEHFDIVQLISYTKPILSYYTDRHNAQRYLEIGCVNYSRTTMRHVAAFLKEFLPPFISYHTLKDIFVSHEDIMVLKIPKNKDEFKDVLLMTSNEFSKYINNVYFGGLAR